MPRSLDDQYKVHVSTYNATSHTTETEELWVGYGEQEPPIRMATVRLLEAINNHLGTIAEALAHIAYDKN